MELYELKYLLTVAEEKNISKAAEKLYIAQPSLSQIISRIETRIKHKIFIRSTAGLKLTREGKKFINLAEKMVALKNDLEMEMQDISSSEYGRISVGIPTFWGSYILPQASTEFHRKHKNVEIVINEATSSLLEAMILKEEVDVAIMTLPILFKDEIQYIELFDEEILLAVSTENKLSQKGIPVKDEKHQLLDPELLRDQPFINFPKGGRLRDLNEEFFKRYDMDPKIVAHVVNIGTAKRFVACNLGVAFLPEITETLYHTPPNPVYFSLGPDIVRKWTVVVAFKNKQHLSKLTKDFIETVENVFGRKKKVFR